MAKQTITSPSMVLKKLMEKYGLNSSKLADAVKLNQATLRLILLEKSKISCTIALKLARFFDKTPEYWLNLQMQYDIAEAAKDKELTAVLKSIKKAVKAAPAKKRAKDADSKKKAAAKKDAPKTQKSGKTADAAGSKKPAKVAGKAPAAQKAAAEPKKPAKAAAGKASAAKKPAVKKIAADKKTAEPKPAGARRGRKPKAEAPIPEPDPASAPGSAFEPDTVFMTEPVPTYGAEPVFEPEAEPASDFQEETPVQESDTFPFFPFSGPAKSEESE